jgi:hypothetical protein
VPWGILKRAIKIAKRLGQVEGRSGADILGGLDDEGFDELTGLICDLFHGEVSLEELNWGTDAGEMAAVMQAVITRAFGQFEQIANPTLPGPGRDTP